LTYGWLTVRQDKAEGVTAYEKSLKDAGAGGSVECAAMFRKLHERDAVLLQEVKGHVFGMIAKGGKSGA